MPSPRLITSEVWARPTAKIVFSPTPPPPTHTSTIMSGTILQRRQSEAHTRQDLSSGPPHTIEMDMRHHTFRSLVLSKNDHPSLSSSMCTPMPLVDFRGTKVFAHVQIIFQSAAAFLLALHAAIAPSYPRSRRHCECEHFFLGAQASTSRTVHSEDRLLESLRVLTFASNSEMAVLKSKSEGNVQTTGRQARAPLPLRAFFLAEDSLPKATGSVPLGAEVLLEGSRGERNDRAASRPSRYCNPPAQRERRGLPAPRSFIDGARAPMPVLQASMDANIRGHRGSSRPVRQDALAHPHSSSTENQDEIPPSGSATVKETPAFHAIDHVRCFLEGHSRPFETARPDSFYNMTLPDPARICGGAEDLHRSSWYLRGASPFLRALCASPAIT